MSWLPEYPMRGLVSTIWKDICSIGDHGSSIGGIVQEGFKIQVFSGQKYFWNHRWLGPQTLKEDFPKLFLLSTQQELIGNIWEGVGNENWGLVFRRDLRDRENLMLRNLVLRLQTYHMEPSKPDSLLWRWTDNKNFTIKSVYEQWEVQTQAMTNGRFVSVRHRALANSNKPRMSIAYFGAPLLHSRITPLPELLIPGFRPALYSPFTWAEYKKAAHSLWLCDSRLDFFRTQKRDVETA